MTDRDCVCNTGGIDKCSNYGCPDATVNKTCQACYCRGTDKKSSSFKGQTFILSHFGGDYGGTGCWVGNQAATINDCAGAFVTISKVSGGFGLTAHYCGPHGSCQYFYADIVSVSCPPGLPGPADTPLHFVNHSSLITQSLRGADGGTAEVYAVFLDTSKCPTDPGGPIYIQDEDTKFSGAECYTNDDLSEYVGEYIQRQENGAWYYVSEGSGTPAVSVTVADSAESCPVDKYAQYMDMAVTIAADETVRCFHVSLGGDASDGEIIILSSQDTCNECCGG
jgi:hypothetical protein